MRRSPRFLLAVATEWLFASDRSALLDELCSDTRSANTHPRGMSNSSNSTSAHHHHHHYHPSSGSSRSSRTTSGAARVTPAPMPYGARHDGVRGSSRADEPQARAGAAASGRNASGSGYGDRYGSGAAAAEGLQHLQRRLQPQQQHSQYTCSTPPRAPAAAGMAARAGTGMGHGHVPGGSPRHPSGRWSDTGCGAVGGMGGSSSSSGAWGWQVVEVGGGAHGEGTGGSGVCGGQQDDPLLVLEPRRVPLKVGGGWGRVQGYCVKRENCVRGWHGLSRDDLSSLGLRYLAVRGVHCCHPVPLHTPKIFKRSTRIMPAGCTADVRRLVTHTAGPFPVFTQPYGPFITTRRAYGSCVPDRGTP